MSVQPRPGSPFGIYIHFPFCARRCPYCDFNVRVVRDIPHAEYRDAILTELRARAPLFEHRRLVSIYFGGGTPGMWEPACVRDVIDAIDALWPRYDDPTDLALNASLYGPSAPSWEVTLEINPRVAHRDRLAAFRDAGVNRLSVGVQTFNPDYLARLGRDHSAQASLQTLADARTVGLHRLSFDLLFGGPHHSLDAFARDLDKAATLTDTADHISAYSLIVEPDTPFAHLQTQGTLHATDDDTVADMLDLCADRLGAAGFAHYEVSNYALPGREARHNSLYWTGAEYMGLGVGAHELRIDPSGTPLRRAGARRRSDYMADPARAHDALERLDPTTHLAERAFLALRTRFGVSLDTLTTQFGAEAVDTLREPLEKLASQGFIQTTPALDHGPAYLQAPGERYVPTTRGLRFANVIARELM